MASAHRYAWTRADRSTGRAWRAKWTGIDGRPPRGSGTWATWHTLWDVYASSLIRQRVDVRTAMTLLGHVSAEGTLRTYGRL